MLVVMHMKTGHCHYINDTSKEFHCKHGSISSEDLNSDSCRIETQKGTAYLKFPATVYDMRQKIKRGPQILLPKDLGYIYARCGLTKESTIIEAGGGSGAATLFFAQSCKKVVTYEIREDHKEIIQKNLDKFSIENCELLLGDLKEEVENIKEQYNLGFFDFPDNYELLEGNLEFISKGSYMVFYLPSISQIQELSKRAETREDVYIEEITEVNLRHWNIYGAVSRPHHKKEIDHTAFLVVVRKC